MDSKNVRSAILLISGILIIWTCFILVKHVCFFVTRIETSPSSVSISKAADYQIQLTYYNLYLEREVSTTVRLKSKYKDEIENFGASITIYYYRFFPRDVYIQHFKVPNEGSLILELLFILIMCLVFKWASRVTRRTAGNSRR
jgi:hypothetical protein